MTFEANDIVLIVIVCCLSAFVAFLAIIIVFIVSFLLRLRFSKTRYKRIFLKCSGS